MAKDKPDHHDADLVLRVYEMRREAVLRESRASVINRFWPTSYDDVQPYFKAEHPMNAPWRQVSTYWEMVYGMVKHDIVHAGYFLESNIEGLVFYAKMLPWVAEIRRDSSPASFRNTEWVATQSPEGQRIFEVVQARVKKLYEARAAKT
jgi:hypothetical protein